MFRVRFSTARFVVAGVLVLGTALGLASSVLAGAPTMPAKDSSDVLDAIRAIALQIWSFDGVKIIIASVLLNTVLAVSVAIKQRAFTFAKLADFLLDLIPYVLVYYACRLIGEAAGFGAASTLVWILIESKLAAAVIANFGELGVQLPGSLARLVAKPVR